MTAIVRTLTLEGYALVADGRSTGDMDGSILTDSAQKIFSVSTTSGTVAYCVAGLVNIVSDDCSRVVVDMADEIRRSAESLATTRTRSLAGYVKQLFRPVCRTIKLAHRSRGFSRFPSQPTTPYERGETILRAYFHEYRDGFPSSIAARLYHENGKLAEPEIITEPLQPTHMASLPVPRIGSIVLEGKEKPLLAAYRQPDIDMCTCTLQQAIERSRALVEAHSDPEALAIDEKCRAVGGHVHIAVLEPSGEFHWVVAPLPRLDAAESLSR